MRLLVVPLQEDHTASGSDLQVTEMAPGTRTSVNTSLHSYNRSHAVAGSVAKAAQKP